MCVVSHSFALSKLMSCVSVYNVCDVLRLLHGPEHADFCECSRCVWKVCIFQLSFCFEAVSRPGISYATLNLCYFYLELLYIQYILLPVVLELPSLSLCILP